MARRMQTGVFVPVRVYKSVPPRRWPLLLNHEQPGLAKTFRTHLTPSPLGIDSRGGNGGGAAFLLDVATQRPLPPYCLLLHQP